MLDRLPIYIQPTSFSERRKEFSGEIKISVLTRFSDLLQDTEGVIGVEFSFKKEGKVPTIQGNLKANLKLECQACLETVTLVIDKDFRLGFVKTLEQADHLPGDCEPFIFGDEKVSLVKLIEEELLLALPDFPRHDFECVEHTYTQIEEEIEKGKKLRSDNPFSVLAKLKNTGD